MFLSKRDPINFVLVVREPLDKVHRGHQALDAWEVVMYILALAFSLEGMIMPCLCYSMCLRST